MEDDSQIDPQNDRHTDRNVDGNSEVSNEFTVVSDVLSVNTSVESEAVELADFDILEKIGEGGMGRVYRARHKGLDKIVALKILASDRTDSAMVRFHNEAKTLSKLRNAFIADVYDFGVSPKGEPYMAIEFIDGPTLQQILEERGKMPVGEVAQLSIEICQALEHAHQKGVIHRDVKPGNVMLDVSDDGTLRPKVVDFGIAKSVDCTSEITRTGSMIGSPLYMSPEQSTGATVTAQSDMYSLACVMFHCLVGKPPFVGDTVIDTIAMKRELPAPLVKDQFPESERTPELLEISKIIDKMLAKIPDQRFRTMKDVESQLNQLLDSMVVDDEAPPAVATTTAQTAPLTGKTSSRSVIFIALTAVSLLSFFILKQLDSTYEVETPRSSEREEGAIMSLPDVKTGEPATNLISQGSLPKNIAPGLTGREDIGFNFNGKENPAAVLVELRHRIDRKEPDFYYRDAYMTDREMELFEACTTAKYVNLGLSKITDASLAHLKKNKLLRLDLSSTPVATLEFLPAKDTLIVLQLSDTKVTDQSLDHLKSCSSLQRLDIHETQITPRGLLKLKHLPLHQINNNRFQEADFPMLEEAFPNCSFNNRKSLIRQRCDDAYKKITQGQGKSAIADLEKLRIKARKNKDFKTEVSYLASIGNFLVEMGQLEEATEIWKKAVKTAEENHCNFQLPEAYNGYLACSRDLYENTPARAKELKGIVEKYVVALDKYQPDEIRRGNSLKVLGKRLMDTRHLDLAKAVYEKSIAEQKGIHFTTMRFVFDPEIKDEQADPAIWQKHDQISLAATQVELGMVLGWQRKIKEARALLQQGIATLEQKTPESKQILWMAYGMAARFERQICKDYERALRYIEQAESVLSNDHLSVPPEISNEKSAILRAMNK